MQRLHYIYEAEHGEPHEDHLPAPPRDPYRRTAEDIARSGLYLHEVILDPEESPRRLLHALASGPLGNVGVAALCAVDSAGQADTWQSVIEAANEYPFEDEDLDTLVLVIDPTAVFDVVGAVVGGVEPQLVDGEIVGNLDDLFAGGPLVPAVSGMDVAHRAMAGWLADMLDELRCLGEETGLRVILVTCDARPEHGYGYMRRSHFFRDGRVRSSIGDAGRYSTHQRYRIERAVKTTYFRAYTEVSENEMGETLISEYHAHEEYEYVTGNVVVLKDEVEGLPGRLVYER